MAAGGAVSLPKSVDRAPADRDAGKPADADRDRDFAPPTDPAEGREIAAEPDAAEPDAPEEPVVSADATPDIAPIAVPTPSMTARAPTRPT